jgi:hypothetical protein
MALKNFLIRKLSHRYIWQRIFLERLTEPLHLNFIAFFVLLLGTWRQKVAFDLILRQHNAFAILHAAEQCLVQGVRKMVICEFGVASGGGLMNMAKIASKVTAITGVEIKVVGFDSGRGLPNPPVDYRDHPEHYAQGNYQMDVDALRANLPQNAELLLGEIFQTYQGFLEKIAQEGYVIGYAVMDVDYYTSCRDALAVFAGNPDLYLPLVLLYLDDIGDITHHPSAGELLAVAEFNQTQPLRKIYVDPFLENRRIFRRANWINHMRKLHVLDHKPYKIPNKNAVEIYNPYL